MQQFTRHRRCHGPADTSDTKTRTSFRRSKGNLGRPWIFAAIIRASTGNYRTVHPPSRHSRMINNAHVLSHQLRCHEHVVGTPIEADFVIRSKTDRGPSRSDGTRRKRKEMSEKDEKGRRTSLRRLVSTRSGRATAG